MKRFRAVDGCARWLLAALGVAVPACSGESTADGASNNPHPCKTPAPVLVDGKDTGLETCGQGVVRRSTALECPERLPRTDSCSYSGTCTTDTDCTEQPHGYCQIFAGGGGAPPSCGCVYGCVSDSECPAGQACLCGDPVGRCVPADCKTGADCGAGLDCVSHMDALCAIPQLACQTAEDECVSDDDCDTGYCGHAPDGHRTCTLNGCGGVGRPFLIEDAPRLAPPVVRADYVASLPRPALAVTSELERGELAAHWTEIGLMEHASIAAFARFALELLALGAPFDLVARCHRAQADETEHAAIAFSFASAYAGRALGPGALNIDGALPPIDAERVLSSVVREGCIGETLAAVEAEHAAERALDPEVRAALERIARDEATHAELAWHFVAWMLECRPELRQRVRDELEGAAGEMLRAPLPPASPNACRRRELGMLSDRERAELRRDAVQRVVLPCLRVLASRRAHCAPSIESL